MELWDSSKTKRKAVEFAAGWDNKPRPPYDDALIAYQLGLSRAYSSELYASGYLSDKEYEAIQDGIETLYKKYLSEPLTVQGYEDVHSFVESRLHELYGDLTGNVHIGLSRNDQVATLMRIYMKDHALITTYDLISIIKIMQKEIDEKGALVFPGYSHYRIAMPTTYGDLLKSYTIALKRDKESLEFWLEQYDYCPLGAAAGFGSPIKIDRHRLASELGFNGPTESLLDSVTTRWEAEAKLADNIKIMMNHLGTMAQDFIINSMTGIDVVLLPAEYCTGSSIMPQKRNPDVLETVKRKAKRIAGESSIIADIGKGNISGYSRDTQETKYCIMNIFQELEGTLDIMSDMIKGIKVSEERAKELLEKGGAYTAAEVIKEAIEKKEPYRSAKLEKERELKK